MLVLMRRILRGNGEVLLVNIYFGSPLFSEMERMYNEYVVDEIRERFGEDVNVYLPQENSEINDKSGYADSVMIAKGDNKYLDESDIMIAVIDGQTVDAGLAAEVGYFHAKGKPVIAIYSDVRQGAHGNSQKIDALDTIAESQFSYVNLYLIGLIKQNGIVTGGYSDMLEVLPTYIDSIDSEAGAGFSEISDKITELENTVESTCNSHAASLSHLTTQVESLSLTIGQITSHISTFNNSDKSDGGV